MKYSIIVGRGIEGCGVTKYTLEQMKWLDDIGYSYEVFASKDKRWHRHNTHETSKIQHLKFAKSEEIDKIIAYSNTTDAVILNSLPSTGHSAEMQAGFKRLLDEITVPIVLIQHDHSILSIKRNALIVESIKRADIVFAHSTNGAFAEYVREVTGSDGISFFGGGDEEKPLFGFQPGMDFEAIKAKYWKPIEEQDGYHLKWIGRNASWKGIEEFISFHEKNVRSSGKYISVLEGIEKDIGFADFKVKHTGYVDKIRHPFEGYDLEALRGGDYAIFGAYDNLAMLERMSRVGFGFQLTLLKPKFLDRSIEYTHCELPAVGVVPVYRKAFGDHVKHRKFGDPLSEVKDSGTIWLEDNNMTPAFELIEKLAADPIMRDEWRHMAFENYKLHQDAKPTFHETFNIINDTVINK